MQLRILHTVYVLRLKSFQIPSSKTSVCSSYTNPGNNQAPRHGDVLNSGGEVPYILTLTSKGNSRLHIPGALGLEKGPRSAICRGLSGTQLEVWTE